MCRTSPTFFVQGLDKAPFHLSSHAVNTTKTPAQALLHIPPSMTKTEVKEYLTKIYNIPVLNVATTNALGKWKRFYGKRRIVAYKRRNIKKATVEFDATLL